MSRQASLKELFTSSRSLPEVENDDFGELTPEREENDLDSNFGPADPDHVSDTDEIDSEIISQPNQPRREKFPPK